MAPSVERTPDGPRLVVSRRVDAPAETVWEVLTDTERWPEWGPSVAAVECDDRWITAGSRGHVRTPSASDVVTGLLGTAAPGRDRSNRGGLRLPFRVVDCEAYRWTWRVARIPATGHRVDPVGNHCRVAIEIPPLAAGYAPVCRRALRAIERLALGA